MLDTVEAYRTAMAGFAAMKNLDVWYAHLDIENTIAEFGSQFKPGLVKRAEKSACQGAHQGQHVGLLQADAASWTARRGSSPNRR